MKSDLKIPKVTGVEMAAVKRADDEELWDIYIINRNGFALNNVLISSRGYGKKNDEEQQTSVLRHMIVELDARTYTKVEPIQKEVFHLTNQYWVSYYANGNVYDKKYIFLPDTIQEKYISPISGFDLEGVLHT